jgi:6-pyruvoyltetrahydropterin/6-carboxytetrahydropterin synthase
MKAYLTRRFRFSAAHRLHNEKLSADENRRLYGKCNNPYGHGHNYALEVTVSGPIDPRTGMICDLGELDTLVEREVIGRFDLENLNQCSEFAGSVPTSEKLAEEIFAILKRSFRAAHLEKIRLEETSQNSFEYAGGGEILR